MTAHGTPVPSPRRAQARRSAASAPGRPSVVGAPEGRGEALLRAVAAAAQELARAVDAEGGISRAVHLLREASGLDRVYVFRHDPAAGGARRFPEWYATSPGLPDLEEEMRRGAPVLLRDADFPEVVGELRAGRVYTAVASRLSGPNRGLNAAAEAEAVAIVPIVVDGGYWGCVGFDDCTAERGWSEAEIAVLEAAAAAIASAVLRERLEAARLAAERARAEEEARVNRLLQEVVAGTRALLDAPDFEPALREWLRMMCQAQGAVSASFYDVVTHERSGRPTVRCLADWSPHPPGSRGRVVISFASPFAIDPRGAEAAVAGLAGGRVVAIHTAELDGLAREQMDAQGHATTVSAPIMDGARWIGAVSFDYWRRRELNPRDEAVLRTAADALAAVLKRNELQARLLGEQRARADENARLAALLQDIAEGANALVHAAGFEAALRVWLGRIGAAMGAARATYYERVTHAPTGLPTHRAVAEWAREGVVAFPVSFAEPLVIDPRENSAFSAALRSGDIFVGHIERTSGELRRLMEAQGNASVLCVPVRRGAEHVGGFGLDFLEWREFTPGYLAAMRVAADGLASAMARRAAEQARLSAERARADESERLTAGLQAVAAGSRRLVDAPDFEAAVLDWLGAMGRAAGAARAAFYDAATHAESGSPTMRVLAEWTREGVGGSIPVSFAAPHVLDPRGAEDLMAAASGTEIVAFHTDETADPMRAYLEAQGNATVLTVPIRLDGRTRHTLSLDFLARREVGARERAVLQTAADAMASVLKRREAEAARLAAERARAEEARAAAADLRRRARLLEAVVAASDDLLRAAGVDEAGPAVVERIGQALAVDRMTIACILPPNERSRAGWFRLAHEWTSPGTPRQSDDPALRTLDLAPYDEFLVPLRAGEPVAIVLDDIADPAARREQEATGALSQFHYPVMVDGALWGTFGGDDCRAPRRFDEAEVATLKLVASALGSLIKRERLAQARLAAERERAEEARAAAAQLARRRDLLEAVVAASDELLATDRVADAAPAVAARIGAALSADRVVVGRILPPDARSTAGYVEFFAEWTAPGIPRQTSDPALARLDMTGYPDFKEPLRRGEAVQMLTERIEHAAGRAEQEATGALSQFQYPIIVDGELWGTFGADDCRAPRVWDEAEVATLRLVASALGNVVRRERLAQARLAAERELAEERARMAREIHDTLAQGFTGVVMQVHATQDALEARDIADAERHMARALDRARAGLSEARRSVYTLRPPLLDDGDLVRALRLVVERVFEGVGTRATFAVRGDVRPLGEAVSIEVFRIAQEALHNALRHARAGRVEVGLCFDDPGVVVLTVADDGVGLDAAAQAQAPSGFGLVSMRERAARIGATFVLDGRPGAGTRVVVSAPTRRRGFGADLAAVFTLQPTDPA